MFLKKFLLATVATTALAGAAFGITACGEEPVQEDHVHNYSWSTVSGATCTEPGVESGKCSCGSTIERRTPAQGHGTLTETPEQAATCGQAGHRAYWTCSKCNNHFADAEGKRQVTVEEMTVTVAHSLRKVAGYGATCTSEGMNTYYTCTNCNKNFSDENGASEVTDLNSLKVAPKHTAVKVDGKAATCTESGIATYYTCSACGKNFSDEACTTAITDLVTEAKGHTMTKVEAVAATCLEGGHTEYWTCSACNKFFSDEKGFNEITEDSTKVAALGHDLHHVFGVDSSCYHTGTIEHWACYTCHKRFDKEVDGKEIETYVIPETHDYKTSIVQKVEPTCTTEGRKAYATCRECGKKFITEGNGVANDTFVMYTSEEKFNKDVVIPCKPHNTVEVGSDEAAAATCIKAGWAKFYWCQDCGNCFEDAECTEEAGFYIIIEQTTPGTPSAGDSTQTPATPATGLEALKKGGDKVKTKTKGEDGTLTDATNEEGSGNNVTKKYWDADNGRVVEALGHLTETRMEGDKEVPFYHYDRNGHWLICRRDCCAEHPRFNLAYEKDGENENKKEVEFGKDKMLEAPIGTEISPAQGETEAKKVEAHAHSFNEQHVCACGWVDNQKTELQIPSSMNSYDGNGYVLPGDTSGKLKTYWDVKEGEWALAGGGTQPYGSQKWSNYISNGCVDLTLPYKDPVAVENKENLTLVAMGGQAFAFNGQADENQIKTIIIPWTVRYLEEKVFDRLDNLENIIFEEAPEGKEDEAGLYIVGSLTFAYLTNLKSITFPSHLKGIVSRSESNCFAFGYNGKIETIIFNSVVKGMKAVREGGGPTGTIIGWEESDEPFKLNTSNKSESYGATDGVKEVYACVDPEDLPIDDRFYLDVMDGCKTYYFGEFTEDEIEWIEREWHEGEYSGKWIEAENEAE